MRLIRSATLPSPGTSGSRHGAEAVSAVVTMLSVARPVSSSLIRSGKGDLRRGCVVPELPGRRAVPDRHRVVAGPPAHGYPAVAVGPQPGRGQPPLPLDQPSEGVVRRLGAAVRAHQARGRAEPGPPVGDPPV